MDLYTNVILDLTEHELEYNNGIWTVPVSVLRKKGFIVVIPKRKEESKSE